jgi:hypothetical protein
VLEGPGAAIVIQALLGIIILIVSALPDFPFPRSDRMVDTPANVS